MGAVASPPRDRKGARQNRRRSTGPADTRSRISSGRSTCVGSSGPWLTRCWLEDWQPAWRIAQSRNPLQWGTRGVTKWFLVSSRAPTPAARDLESARANGVVPRRVDLVPLPQTAPGEARGVTKPVVPRRFANAHSRAARDVGENVASTKALSHQAATILDGVPSDSTNSMVRVASRRVTGTDRSCPWLVGIRHPASSRPRASRCEERAARDPSSSIECDLQSGFSRASRHSCVASEAHARIN